MRKFLLYGGVGILVLLIAGVIVADHYVKNLDRRARQRVIAKLSDRFDADVSLASLHLHLLPIPGADGESLLIRHKGWQDQKPLISIAKFHASSEFWDLLFQRDMVSSLSLEGLVIDIPPRGRSAFITNKKDQYDIETAQPGQDKTHLRFTIQTLIANGTTLVIEPKQEGKEPLRFDIEKLTMHSVGPGQPMKFAATLHNAKPPGLIQSSGVFGPWQKDDPRSTPVHGSYEFRNADLGVFKGISGILSSAGKYEGVLQHIEVDGSTDVPQFALKQGGSPVHLKTTFHSIVNGTDGDTVLDPVDASFLHSEFICRGGVAKLKPDEGKTVDLYAVSKHARIEDILELVLGDQRRILFGDVAFRSKITIPPIHERVLNKLKLDGDFHLRSAVFASEDVEGKLRTLSDRARGITKDEQEQLPKQTVASNMDARFTLQNGRVLFSHLVFTVPGAEIKLHGGYRLHSEKVAMSGVFRMQATASDTQSGIKHWILKPFDPLFEKDGAGFEVPLTIEGTRQHPGVSIDVFHHRFTMK